MSAGDYFNLNGEHTYGGILSTGADGILRIEGNPSHINQIQHDIYVQIPQVGDIHWNDIEGAIQLWNGRTWITVLVAEEIRSIYEASQRIANQEVDEEGLERFGKIAKEAAGITDEETKEEQEAQGEEREVLTDLRGVDPDDFKRQVEDWLSRATHNPPQRTHYPYPHQPAPYPTQQEDPSWVVRHEILPYYGSSRPFITFGESTGFPSSTYDGLTSCETITTCDNSEEE